MSFDDELSERMKQAAQRAGSDADPAAASANLTAAMAATGGGGSIGLLGGLAVIALLVGVVLGATAFRRSGALAETPSVAFVEVGAYDCPEGSLCGTCARVIVFSSPVSMNRANGLRSVTPTMSVAPSGCPTWRSDAMAK